MTKQLRTGVVLQFVARERAHGSGPSGLARNLSAPNHFLNSHEAVREVADGSHLCEGHLLPPLTDGPLRDTEVRCDGGRPARALIEPSREVHGPSLGFRKPESQEQSKRGRFSISSPMPNPRRERFLAYFMNGPLKGDRAKLMHKTGLTKGRVSQLFDEGQAFGELAARNLAEKLGLPSNAFEADQATAPHGLSDDAIAVAQQFDRMTPVERVRFVRLMQAAQDGGGTQWVGDLGTLKKAG